MILLLLFLTLVNRIAITKKKKEEKTVDDASCTDVSSNDASSTVDAWSLDPPSSLGLPKVCANCAALVILHSTLWTKLR